MKKIRKDIKGELYEDLSAMGIAKPGRPDKRAVPYMLPSGETSYLRKLYPEVGDLLTQKEIDMQGYTPKKMRHNEHYSDLIQSYRPPTPTSKHAYQKQPTKFELMIEEENERAIEMRARRKQWEKEHRAETITGTIKPRKKSGRK